MTSASALIWVAALAWLLSRQLQRRPIGGRRRGGRSGRRGPIALLLLLAGAVELVAFTEHHHLDATTVGILCASFVVGAGLGVARGFTVRLWVENGQLFRQGTLVTAALWVLAAGLHLGSAEVIRQAGGPAGASSASMLLYLALSLTVQTRVLRHRARARLAVLRGERAEVLTPG
jgi:hypothetical protein